MHDTAHGLEAIVDRQVRYWHLKRQAKKRKQKGGSRHWPVVTVSREFGSLGAAMGKLVAERFGFEYWDQELVHAMADQTGVDEALLATLDEHARSNVEVLIDGIFRGEAYTESEYLRQLMRVVHTIGNHGNAVVIGRGSQYILEDEEALHVRAVCPREIRVAGLCERRGITKAKARKELESIEKDRHTFIEHHYRCDVRDASAYDIVINTGTLTVDQAADLVVSCYQARFGGLPRRPRADG